MDISNEAYRQVIGAFQFKPRKSKTIYYKTKVFMKGDSKSWQFAFCLLSYLIVVSTMLPSTNPNPNLKCVSCDKIKITKPLQRLTAHQIKITKPFKMYQTELVQAYTGGISWYYSADNNKICHIINGNRRNLGYKYFMWNCDRGVLKENKIEDVRIFAERKSPHIMTLIEVNLTRSEENRNIESVTQLSTQQVLDKFHVENYNIIFPDSWEKHNVARILCYVHCDVKAKKIQLKAEESHLQSVLLEVGF